MARVCIVSRKEVPAGKGTPIKQDAIIGTIRKIKSRLGILQNNELVVSDECLEEYQKKRSKFEKMAVVIHLPLPPSLFCSWCFAPLLFGAPFNPMSIFFCCCVGHNGRSSCTARICARA